MSKIYGIQSCNQLGDSACLTGAVENVCRIYNDVRFLFTGNRAYSPLFDNNPLFVKEADSFIDLGLINYGYDEPHVARGNHIHAQTFMLCEKINLPYVQVKVNHPVFHLTDEEIEWGGQFHGKWLINANAQTCSVSKFYPFAQQVVNGMNNLGLKVVQVGGKESRDISQDLVGVEDWRGKTNIRQYLSMVYNCEAIVSPPSGIIHIGATWGKPMLIIKGAREPEGVTGYPNSRYISTVCDHANCYAQTVEQCHHHYSNGISRCMNISPEWIVSEIKTMVGSGSIK